MGPRSVAQDLYLTCEAAWDPESDVFDYEDFRDEISKRLRGMVPDSIAPRNARERDALEYAIKERAEYSAIHFDPAALDVNPRDRGAAQPPMASPVRPL